MLKKAEYEELKRVLIEEVGKEMFEKGDRLELKRLVEGNIKNGVSKFNDMYREYLYREEHMGWRYNVVDYDRFYKMLKILRSLGR